MTLQRASAPDETLQARIWRCAARRFLIVRLILVRLMLVRHRLALILALFLHGRLRSYL